MRLRILNRLNYINSRNTPNDVRNLTSQAKMNIQNFVFFDIETTGLPYQEYNKTRITELCFVAVQSEHLSLGVYPRVQNKLALCFNPHKFINPQATEITGLSNELLQYQPAFNKDTCQIINKFLELQVGPVCFVAHNGNYFDYPILKAELNQAGCELKEDIFCIDSLQMFRDIDKSNAIILQEISQASGKESTSEPNIHDLPTQKDVPIELCDGFDELLCDALDSFENTSNINAVQNTNENTPKKSNTTFTYANQNQVKTVPSGQLYYTPSPLKRTRNEDITICETTTNGTESQPPQARKRLDFGHRTYKLIDVYKRLTNKENDNAHLADQDVNMLIECAATLGQSFVDWANNNAKKFADIPMMKPGVKIGS